MTQDPETKSNVTRLLTRLEHGSLAHRLVQAHHTADPMHAAERMKAVLRQRIEEVRDNLEDSET